MSGSIESFVESVQTALDVSEAAPGAQPSHVRRKMRTVARSCGWKSRSHKRIEQLKLVMDHAGIYAFPEITDPNVTMDTFIAFSRTDRAARSLGKIFGKEEGIHRFVQEYYADVFHGHDGLEGLKLVGKEVPFYVGSRKLKADLVFESPEGKAVIVEFKRGDPGLNAPAQLRRHMEAARTSYDGVAGVLITARPRTEALEKAIRREIASQQDEFPIEWFWYSVEVDLHPA